MRSPRVRHNGRTSPWSGIFFGIVCVIVVTFFSILGLQNSGVASQRVNVVVATNPITVWSWNRVDNTFIVLSIPSDDVIDALYGYGNYSLDALWRLGFIDKKGGLLLSDSLSDTVGLPIDWYIGSKSLSLTNISDPLGYGKTLFSLTNIFSFMDRAYQSNMPMGLFIAFSQALTGARPDKINEINVGNLDVVNEVSLPDGESQKIISPDYLDHALGGVFESDIFRTEGLSVALYNTTHVPALGNRAARLLTNAGILVVTVGNDEQPIHQCDETGSTKSLSTNTARYITGLFHCRKIISSDGSRADLIIRLGNDFAKRFVASQK